MKFILAFLLFSFLNISLFAQAIPIKEIDLIKHSYSLTSGRVGKKLIWTQTSTPIWETDGTKNGTKKLDIQHNESISFLQISPDSLIIVVHKKISSELQVYLYTSSMDTPYKIATLLEYNEFHFNRKIVGNQLIILADNTFNFVNLKTHEVDNVAFQNYLPKPKFYVSESVVLKNKIYFLTTKEVNLEVDIRLSYIDLQTHQLFALDQKLDSHPKFCLLPSKEKFLYSTIKDNAVWSFDGNEFVLEEEIQTIPRPALRINDKLLYFSHTNQNGTFKSTLNVFNKDDQLFELKKFDKKIDINSRIILKDKYFFQADQAFWETNGTKVGTKKYQNNLDVNILYDQQASKDGIVVIGEDKDHFLGTYLFDGTPNLVSLSNLNQKRTFKQETQNLNFLTDTFVYLKLLDLDYGLELHRYNRITKKMKIVSDHNPYAQWSNTVLIGQSEKGFFYAFTKDNKTTLYFINKNSTLPDKPQIKKIQTKWTEQIARPINSSNIQLINSFVDKQHNTIISFEFQGEPSRNILLYQNRQSTLSSLFPHKLAKFDQNGKFIWLKAIPSKTFTKYCVQSINDSKGNIITASILPPFITNFEGKEISLLDGELLILKQDPDGNLLWYRQAHIGEGSIHQISIDSKDQIILTGKFSQQTASFGEITISSSRNPTTYVAKYSDNGEAIWAKSFPLPYFMPSDRGALKLSIGQNDNIFFTQRIGNKQNLSCEEATGKYRFLVNSIASNDGHLRWTNTYGGTNFCFPADIAASPNGNIYVIGGYNEEIQLGEIKLSTGSCASSSHFLLKVNGTDGNPIQAKKINFAADILNQVIVDDAENYYITGHVKKLGFFGYINPFDTATVGYFTRDWQHDEVFIKKYNQLDSLVAQEYFHQNTNPLEQYDQPDLNPILNLASDGDWIISLQNVSPIDSFNITTVGFHNRIFLIKLTPKDDIYDLIVDGKISDKDILLSPNPATNIVQIQSTDLDFTQATITIYAMDGKQWQPPMEQNNGFIRLNIKDLPTGSYVVVIRLKDQVLEKQFVKF